MASTIVASGGFGKLALDGVAGKLVVRRVNLPTSWQLVRIAAYLQLDAPAAPSITADFQFGLARLCDVRPAGSIVGEPVVVADLGGERAGETRM